MNTLQEELKSISESLAMLSRQVEHLSESLGGFKAARGVFGRKADTAAETVVETRRTAPDRSTVLDTVFEVIKRSRKGATIAKLKEKTGLEARQLSNALYKLSKRGRIEARSRGLYVKKSP